jgi:hypothetical protein
VASVLNAIQELDEDLVEIICELMQTRGRGGKFNPKPLADKITVLGPTVDLTTLQTSIFIEIVDALGSFWHEMYGRLVAYFKKHGHSDVPQHYEDKQLANWVKKLRARRARLSLDSVKKLRARKTRLSSDRIALLDKLNFVWDPNDVKWNEMYEQLAAYHSENGHSNIPTTHENQKLYRWCAVQRREAHLTLERKALLDKLGFQWRKMEGKWDEFFAKLLAYKNEHGNVSVVHGADKSLTRWISAQRRKKQQGLLSAERIEKLEQIGFVWKPEDILKSAEFGRTQGMFEELALGVLRSVDRPMKSGELIEEFRKRGHPIPGNAVRTAWNRLWTARKNGVLISCPRLGYWLPDKPLSEEAKQQAVLAQRGRPRRRGPSLRVLSRGKRKGPPPALTPRDVQRAEKLLLAGKTRVEVAVILGGISLNTLRKYIPGGITGLQAKYPNVVIPKRPHVSSPRRPGAERLGRPPALTVDQAREIAEMRT